MSIPERVHALDGQGLTAQQIAVGVGVSVARVLEILDDVPMAAPLPPTPDAAAFAAKEKQTRIARWEAWRRRKGLPSRKGAPKP